MPKIIVNLNQHPLHFFDAEGKEVIKTIEPFGIVARLDETRTPSDPIVGIDGTTFPTMIIVMGAIQNLPPPEPDTIYVVSLLVRLAANQQGRFDDIASPANEVRNEKGTVIGMRGLVFGCPSCQ